MITATIKVNAHTAGHWRTLMESAYDVQSAPTVLTITATVAVETEVDATSKESLSREVADLIEARALWTYRTPFRFSDGKVLRGVFALGRLAKHPSHPDAFVAKVTKATKTGWQW